MIFNSVTYLLFLLIVVILFYNLPKRLRLGLIFASSIIFYGFWSFHFVSLMLISAANDFFVSKLIHATPIENKKRRFRLLMVSLFVNLGLLFLFKYLYFFTENVNSILGLIAEDTRLPLIKLILPLGISFYTFQTISYTVDVYRGFRKPLDDFILYGSYVMFFPQLVAGPILRTSEVVEQLVAKPVFKLANINVGIQRILYGLFLKVVLADNIAPLVDAAFELNPNSLSAIDVWTMAFLFGFQIYFDFAAYSHIAIGSAKLMGIQFPENFNYPYVSNSFKEFWKRWHISLSSWIRDYLYLPLAGIKVVNNKSVGGIGDQVDQSKKNKSLFLTWAIMGLWHGANWTFVFWGVYHSVLIYMERQVKKLTKGLPKAMKNPLGWIITLNLAMLSWIPFRAENITDTFIMMGKVVNPFEYLTLGLRENIYIVTFLVLILHLLTYLLLEKWLPKIEKILWLNVPIQIVKYTVIMILVFTFLRPITQFIYFQF